VTRWPSGKISPDGAPLSFTADVGGVCQLFVRSPEARVERQLTTAKQSLDDYLWTGDARYIVFPQDAGGDEGYHLYAIDPRTPGAAVRDLTPFAGVSVEVIGVPSEARGAVLFQMNRRNPELMDAFRVDVGSGAVELAAENPAISSPSRATSMDAFWPRSPSMGRAATTSLRAPRSSLRSV
jgi:hypothetical protein